MNALNEQLSFKKGEEKSLTIPSNGLLGFVRTFTSAIHS